MRRILCVGFYVICMLFIFAACGETARYNAGTYTSIQKGFGGDMTVEVEFDSNSILSVAVIEHNETDNFGVRAIEMLPGDILEAQSVEVDSVTSATITSEAIKKAVVDCIQQAEK